MDANLGYRGLMANSRKTRRRDCHPHSGLVKVSLVLCMHVATPIFSVPFFPKGFAVPFVSFSSHLFSTPTTPWPRGSTATSPNRRRAVTCRPCWHSRQDQFPSETLPSIHVSAHLDATPPHPRTGRQRCQNAT